MQGVASWVVGTPAGQLKTGDSMVWNYGTITKVGRILGETAKMVELEDIMEGGGIYVRKMRKDRIVARPAEEIQGQ